MNDVASLIMKRSTPLWIGSGLLFASDLMAGYSGNIDLLKASLILTGAFALYGVGFGIWAGRTLARPT